MKILDKLGFDKNYRGFSYAGGIKVRNYTYTLSIENICYYVFVQYNKDEIFNITFQTSIDSRINWAEVNSFKSYSELFEKLGKVKQFEPYIRKLKLKKLKKNYDTRQKEV